MSKVKIVVFILIAAALIAGGRYYSERLDKQAEQRAIEEAQKIKDEQAKIMANLKVEDVVLGAGDEAKNGDAITVNYLGTLADGKKFDSSYDRKEPFTFNLGKSEVIKGWDLGVLGMKVGGKRKLTIPPELGYGANGSGPIPPNATLLFTIELLGVKAQ